MEYKDIDRLFQEKLKDIEVAPNPRVWKTVEKKLQKKKRRIVPFWWFSGAAIVVLGFFFFFNNSKPEEKVVFPTITKTKDSIHKDSIHKDSVFDVIVEKTKENNIIKVDKNIETSKKGSQEIIKKNNTSIKQVIVERNIKNTSETKDKNEVLDKNLFLIDKAIAKKENQKRIETNTYKTISMDEEIAIKIKDNNSERRISSSEGITEEKNVTEEKTIPKKDFIAEITKQGKEKEKLKETQNKWGVSPIVGVLRSNSFAKVSSLDSNLNNNDFSGENTLSYGINFSYKLNNKWAIKSGIQLQKTVFTTNDVTISSSAFETANTIDNIVLNNNNNSSSDEFDVLNGQQQVTTENGNLIQSYGYVEIPIEVKYTFFSAKKIRTSIVSGFSSLILNENSIVGESETFNEDIGGASNLNTINFSGNFGLDFDVSISKKLNININPMFKTQLNTFSNDANGFKPYFIGIYSGLNYQF